MSGQATSIAILGGLLFIVARPAGHGHRWRRGDHRDLRRLKRHNDFRAVFAALTAPCYLFRYAWRGHRVGQGGLAPATALEGAA